MVGMMLKVVHFYTFFDSDAELKIRGVRLCSEHDISNINAAGLIHPASSPCLKT